MVSNRTGIAEAIKIELAGGITEFESISAKTIKTTTQTRLSAMATARLGAIARHRAIVAEIARAGIDHKDTGVGRVPLMAALAIVAICATAPELEAPITTSSGGSRKSFSLRSASRGSAANREIFISPTSEVTNRCGSWGIKTKPSSDRTCLLAISTLPPRIDTPQKKPRGASARFATRRSSRHLATGRKEFLVRAIVPIGSIRPTPAMTSANSAAGPAKTWSEISGIF